MYNDKKYATFLKSCLNKRSHREKQFDRNGTPYLRTMHKIELCAPVTEEFWKCVVTGKLRTRKHLT